MICSIGEISVHNMRIGTWNLNAKPLVNQHLELILGADCDIWLLTELKPQELDTENKVADFFCHRSAGVMDSKAKQH